MTPEASRGQDQEYSRLPKHSYAMEEDFDVTSRTEVIFHLWSLRILISFQCLGLQQPNTIKTEKPLLLLGNKIHAGAQPAPLCIILNNHKPICLISSVTCV